MSWFHRDTKPSRVTTTSNGKTYTCNANGNMLTNGTDTYTWDRDKRLACRLSARS